jgi:hypothetical protein
VSGAASLPRMRRRLSLGCLLALSLLAFAGPAQAARLAKIADGLNQPLYVTRRRVTARGCSSSSRAAPSG